ncbi:hypothetical protein [Flavobacterium ginsengiterrae]
MKKAIVHWRADYHRV